MRRYRSSYSYAYSYYYCPFSHSDSIYCGPLGGSTCSARRWCGGQGPIRSGAGGIHECTTTEAPCLVNPLPCPAAAAAGGNADADAEGRVRSFWGMGPVSGDSLPQARSNGQHRRDHPLQQEQQRRERQRAAVMHQLLHSRLSCDAARHRAVGIGYAMRAAAHLTRRGNNDDGDDGGRHSDNAGGASVDGGRGRHTPPLPSSQSAVAADPPTRCGSAADRLGLPLAHHHHRCALSAPPSSPSPSLPLADRASLPRERLIHEATQRAAIISNDAARVAVEGGGGGEEERDASSASAFDVDNDAHPSPPLFLFTRGELQTIIIPALLRLHCNWTPRPWVELDIGEGEGGEARRGRGGYAPRIEAGALCWAEARRRHHNHHDDNTANAVMVNNSATTPTMAASADTSDDTTRGMDNALVLVGYRERRAYIDHLLECLFGAARGGGGCGPSSPPWWRRKRSGATATGSSLGAGGSSSSSRQSQPAPMWASASPLFDWPPIDISEHAAGGVSGLHLQVVRSPPTPPPSLPSSSPSLPIDCNPPQHQHAHAGAVEGTDGSNGHSGSGHINGMPRSGSSSSVCSLGAHVVSLQRLRRMATGRLLEALRMLAADGDDSFIVNPLHVVRGRLSAKYGDDGASGGGGSGSMKVARPSAAAAAAAVAAGASPSRQMVAPADSCYAMMDWGSTADADAEVEEEENESVPRTRQNGRSCPPPQPFAPPPSPPSPSPPPCSVATALSVYNIGAIDPLDRLYFSLRYPEPCDYRRRGGRGRCGGEEGRRGAATSAAAAAVHSLFLNGKWKALDPSLCELPPPPTHSSAGSAGVGVGGRINDYGGAPIHHSYHQHQQQQHLLLHSPATARRSALPLWCRGPFKDVNRLLTAAMLLSGEGSSSGNSPTAALIAGSIGTCIPPAACTDGDSGSGSSSTRLISIPPAVAADPLWFKGDALGWLEREAGVAVVGDSGMLSPSTQQQQQQKRRGRGNGGSVDGADAAGHADSSSAVVAVGASSFGMRLSGVQQPSVAASEAMMVKGSPRQQHSSHHSSSQTSSWRASLDLPDFAHSVAKHRSQRTLWEDVCRTRDALSQQQQRQPQVNNSNTSALCSRHHHKDGQRSTSSNTTNNTSRRSSHARNDPSSSSSPSSSSPSSSSSSVGRRPLAGRGWGSGWWSCPPRSFERSMQHAARRQMRGQGAHVKGAAQMRGQQMAATEVVGTSTPIPFPSPFTAAYQYPYWVDALTVQQLGLRLCAGAVPLSLGASLAPRLLGALLGVRDYATVAVGMQVAALADHYERAGEDEENEGRRRQRGAMLLGGADGLFPPPPLQQQQGVRRQGTRLELPFSTSTPSTRVSQSDSSATAASAINANARNAEESSRGGGGGSSSCYSLSHYSTTAYLDADLAITCSGGGRSGTSDDAATAATLMTRKSSVVMGWRIRNDAVAARRSSISGGGDQHGSRNNCAFDYDYDDGERRGEMLPLMSAAALSLSQLPPPPPPPTAVGVSGATNKNDAAATSEALCYCRVMYYTPRDIVPVVTANHSTSTLSSSSQSSPSPSPSPSSSLLVHPSPQDALQLLLEWLESLDLQISGEVRRWP